MFICVANTIGIHNDSGTLVFQFADASQHDIGNLVCPPSAAFAAIYRIIHELVFAMPADPLWWRWLLRWRHGVAQPLTIRLVLGRPLGLQIVNQILEGPGLHG